MRFITGARIAFLVTIGWPSKGFAAPGAWAGTWKLDEALSQPIGPTFTYIQSSTGEYVVNTGDHLFRFFCNGQDYPTLPHHSMSCVQPNPVSMDMVYRLDGKEVSRSHRELSADRRTLRVSSKESRTDGSSAVKTFVYQRTSGSTGFVGGWTELDQSARRPPIFVISIKDHIFHLSFSGKQQHTDIPLTGIAAPVEGLAPGVHASLSAKPLGPRELLVEQKLDGVAVREVSMTLNQDGRTLIQKTWRPDNPSLKETLVYQKQ